MPDSATDIFRAETDQPTDPAVRRGIGAVLGLAVVIAGSALLAGTVVVAAFAGLVTLFTSAQTEVVAFTQLSCRLAGHDVVVSATIARGDDFETDFSVSMQGWDPDGLYFDTDRPEDAPSLVPGDRVSFSGPASRADEITGVRMGIWRGEPGYAQTVPLSVDVSVGGCVASTVD